MDRRGGALGRRSHEGPEDRDEEPLAAAWVLSPEGCADHARMERIGRDGGASQPPGQLVGEQDVGELGLVVGARPGI
jgi:hypothetical protein